jgi:hypothetical protein
MQQYLESEQIALDIAREGRSTSQQIGSGISPMNGQFDRHGGRISSERRIWQRLVGLERG